MILTKNRLKKIKFKDDDEMLYYLKYSHLEPIREDDILGIETSDKMTQFPDIMNNFAQTENKVMVDKETDTFDELNKIDPPYYLTLDSKNYKSKEHEVSRRPDGEPSRAEKMAEVWSKTVDRNSPPTSNSEDDDEGSFSRNLGRGLRMAQLTGSAMLTAFNIADTVGSAVLSPVIGSAIDLLTNNPTNEAEEEEEEAEVQEEAEAEAEQAEIRERSRSRDNSEENDLGNRLLSRGASRSRSVTPSSSTPASSAKTTPRKKHK